ncbi:MAG: YbaK/EbsC family protein [Pseudomonadota bacterium]
MSKSVKRVAKAALNIGLEIEITRMGQSTRTAEEAAAACGCSVAQIVKSMIFQAEKTGDLVLLLISGANQADLEKSAAVVGEPLVRAKPEDVRAQTGFAIGGVSPIGHLKAPRIWMDRDLLSFGKVWAAAGAPDAVFQIAPEDLAKATGATIASLAR